MSNSSFQLIGRLILIGEIRAITGLRIGGSPGALAIGGVDLPVIRNGLDQKPYIPGSSLKGKMRSLAEKATGAPSNRDIGRDVRIHTAGGNGKRDFNNDDNLYKKVGMDQYSKYWVNPLFGVPGEVGIEVSGPTRLIVRDVSLTRDSAEKLNKAKTDLPYSEVKWEAAIDRITSAATPRQVERVPAGAVFGPMELVLNFFISDDVQHVSNLLTCLQLVEDDYLGGHGTRGSGKVSFEKLDVTWRSTASYTKQHKFVEQPFTTLQQLVERQGELRSWVINQITPEGT